MDEKNRKELKKALKKLKDSIRRLDKYKSRALNIPQIGAADEAKLEAMVKALSTDLDNPNVDFSQIDSLINQVNKLSQ